jgi:hypothetical protein
MRFDPAKCSDSLTGIFECSLDLGAVHRTSTVGQQGGKINHFARRQLRPVTRREFAGNVQGMHALRRAIVAGADFADGSCPLGIPGRRESHRARRAVERVPDTFGDADAPQQSVSRCTNDQQVGTDQLGKLVQPAPYRG